ncbi:hypothetical protein CAPTEDRAFT_219902 [Capitella teleta]|uniref:Sushi domain-containing protein n=1 Tax=Capitella teleta TaxID=283909 RepID=R7URK8_CAPTE|nr:hypothetical protein CAPTEDRAFT_219902 [Capitella teleta]|eukprot:ELU06031.1 hypothetical protein CAPTEDRAFT_219902 [Capitella teleta]
MFLTPLLLSQCSLTLGINGTFSRANLDMVFLWEDTKYTALIQPNKFERATLIFGALLYLTVIDAQDWNSRQVFLSSGRDEFNFINRIDYSYFDTTNDDLWHRITGGNVEGGDVAKFTAYLTDKIPKRWWQWQKYYPYMRAMYVCYGDSQRTAPGSILTKKECRDVKFKFFVKTTNEPGLKQLNYVTCSTKTEGSTKSLHYSRLHRTSVACKDGHIQEERGHFFVKEIVVPCREPEQIQNGKMSKTHISSQGVLERVRYTCNEGYGDKTDQGDSREDWRCNTATGTWSGRLLDCRDFSCSFPPSFDYATTQPKDTYANLENAVYRCITGYRFETNDRIQCQRGQWERKAITCTKMSCGNPGKINNGGVEATGYEYGDSVMFHCDDGFVLVGNKEASCNSRGTWSSPRPSCNKISCPVLPSPDRGTRSTTNNDIGSQVEFSCDEGYNLRGDSTLTCLEAPGSTGIWDHPTPICEVIKCEPIEALQNGAIAGNDFTYGNSVTFTCTVGFRLYGEPEITCGPRGWSAKVPVCQQIYCVVVNTKEFLIHEPTQDSLTYNEVLQFACQDGYTLKGTTKVTCQENGRWSDVFPTCEPSPCPPLPTPVNGHLSDSMNVYGSVVHTYCFPGYEIEGNETNACMKNGRWQNSSPTCVAFECGPLEVPEHGMMTECDSNIGGSCSFLCEAGFFMTGSDVRRCMIGGWTGTTTQCTPCPEGSYRSEVGTGTTCFPCSRHSTSKMGSTSEADCHCEEGYENLGEGCRDIDECAVNNGNCSQTCFNNEGGYTCSCSIPGYKISEDGTCTRYKSCPPLDDKVGGGNLICSEYEEYNSNKCKINCNAGYFFVSGVNNYVSCGPSTQYEWSHQLVNKTAAIPNCMEEFFVDISIPLSFKYSADLTCDSISEMQPTLFAKLQEAIHDLEWCNEQGDGHCQISNFNSSCSDPGETGDSSRTEVEVTIDVLVENENKDPVSPECDPPCQGLNLRQMLQRTYLVKSEFEKLVQVQSDSLTLSNRFDVDKLSFEFGKLMIWCEEGKVLTNNRLCVPCDAGYYLPSKSLKHCKPCPVGTYQVDRGQTSCEPCLPGSTTMTEGANHPTLCNARTVAVGEGPVKNESEVEVEELETEEDVEKAFVKDLQRRAYSLSNEQTTPQHQSERPTGCYTMRAYYSLVVNDLIRSLKDRCQPDGYLHWLHSLMLMDYTAILASNREHALEKIRILSDFCKSSGMVRSNGKTKFTGMKGTDENRQPLSDGSL